MKDLNKTINIVLVSLADKFCKGVGVMLSGELDMFNADAKEMVVYDLINPKEVLEKCGLEYLKKRERGVISSVCEYQSTIITMSFDLFNDNLECFNNSLVIFLKLPLKSVETTVNQLDYKFRNDQLAKNSDLTIDLDMKSKKKAVNEILLKLKGE